MLSTLPVALEMLRSMRPSSRASEVILKIGAPPDIDSSRVCSCPPMITSTPEQRASCLSSAIDRCVSATMVWAPAARIFGMTRAAVAQGSMMSMSGPVREVCSVSRKRMPKMPTFTPSNSRMTNSGVSAKTFPVFLSMTLAASHLNFDSAIRCRSTSGPKSNSWLPKVA